jgi:hypothetical protein
VEQNGPYLVTGKHNVILRATTEAIARELGNALVAPVVPFVPEGDLDPPSGHMQYPGTISVREGTFRAEERRRAGLFRIIGIELGPLDETLKVARELVANQARVTVEAIRERTGVGLDGR